MAEFHPPEGLQPKISDDEHMERLREIASDLMLTAARDISDVTIVEQEEDGLCMEDYETVTELIQTATITIEFPEEKADD